MQLENKRVKHTYRDEDLRPMPRQLSDADMRKFETWIERQWNFTADERRKVMRTLKRMQGIDAADDTSPLVEALRRFMAEMRA